MTELDDQRLAALLEAAAPDVSTDGVVDAVTERVRHRRTARARRRMASALGVAAAAVLVTVGLVAVLDDGRPTDLRTADGPSGSSATTASPGAGGGDEDRGRELQRVEVPGTGDTVVPVAQGGTWFWVARGSSSQQAGSGPRTISRIGVDGSVGPLTTVEGIPVLGQVIDDLWVVVVEPQAEGAPAWRLKRIRQLDGVMVASIPVPLTAEPLQLQRRVDAGGGTSVVIVSAAEAVSVTIGDHRVSVEPGPFAPRIGAPQIEPSPIAQRADRAWWIEGTDVVAREVER